MDVITYAQNVKAVRDHARRLQQLDVAVRRHAALALAARAAAAAILTSLMVFRSGMEERTDHVEP